MKKIGRTWDHFEDGARHLARRKGRPIPVETITRPTTFGPLTLTLNYAHMERVREAWRKSPQNG